MTQSANTIVTQLQKLPPQWVAAVVGAAFSLWSIAQNPILNNDAYQYLRAAELFNSDGALAVFARYGWFNYSILIALFNKLLPGDLLVSAHVLNLLLQTLLITAFIRLSQRLHGGRRIPALAALVLLAYPQLNEMRFMLIRDFGFWAFALLGLEQLLLVRDTNRWQHGLLWALCLVLATAFRLEALLLAAVSPLALLGNNNRKLVLLYAMLLLLAVVASVVCTVLGIDLLAQMQFAYRYYLPLLFDLPTLMSQASQTLMQQLFSADNFPAHNNAAVGHIVLLFAYVYSVLAILVQALSVPLSLLLLHALWRGWLRPAEGWRGPLAVYAICAFLSLVLFISIMHFLTERYTMLLCLMLLLLVPGVLNRWIDHAQAQSRKRRYIAAACFWAFYYFTDSLVGFGYSTQYMQQAGSWLHTNAVAGTALYSNEPYLAYSSGQVPDYDQSRMSVAEVLAKAQSGSMLALTLDASDHASRTLVDQDQRLVLEQRFANRRDDEVRIYQVH